MGKMAQKKQQKSLRIQIIEYFIAGGAFFWSGYIAFFIFDSIFHLPLFVAKQLANLIGLSINYVLEDQWVFKHNKARVPYDRRRTYRYIIITVINFAIDYLIVMQLKEIGITPYLGQFASAGLFTIWNFLWYKYWVFAHTPSQKKGKRRVRRKK